MFNRHLFIAKFALLATLFTLESKLAYAVDFPINLRGTEVAQSMVKWEWSNVNDATHYEITIDGDFKSTTKDTKFFSYNLWPGEHSMHVVAVTDTDERSFQSATIKIFVNVGLIPITTT